MRKKYLSALLFGALLFASAGTFTSCKDYDEDINNLQNQITANADAIKALQELVNSGKYVTAVSGNENVITFTFTDGTTQQVTVETAEQEAQTVTIGEDGEVIINGEGTGFYTTKTPTEAEVEAGLIKKGANGTWEVLGENGEYTDTKIPVSGVTVSGSEAEGYTFTIVNANGESQTVKLPSAASAITSIDARLMGVDDTKNTIEIKEYDFDTEANRTRWKDLTGKDITTNKIILTSADVIAARINPVNAEATQVNFSLTNSKNETLPGVIFKATEYKGYVTSDNVNSRADYGNGLYTLGMKSLEVKDESTVDNSFKLTSDNANILYALNAQNACRGNYQFGVTIVDKTVNIESYLIDNDEDNKVLAGIETPITDATKAYTYEVPEAIAPSNYPDYEEYKEKVDAKVAHSVSTEDMSEIYDMWLTAEDYDVELFDLTFDQEKHTFTINADPDIITKADFVLTVHTINNEGEYHKKDITINVSNKIVANADYATREWTIVNDENKTSIKTKNAFFADMKTMTDGLGSQLAAWQRKVETAEVKYYTDAECKNAVTIPDTGSGIDLIFTNADNNEEVAIKDAVNMKFAIDNDIASKAFSVDKVYYAEITFSGDNSELNTIVVPFKFSIPELSTLFAIRDGYVVDGVINAYFYQVPAEGTSATGTAASAAVELERYFSKYVADAYVKVTGKIGNDDCTKLFAWDTFDASLNTNEETINGVKYQKFATLKTDGTLEKSTTLELVEGIKDGKPAKAYGEAVTVKVTKDNYYTWKYVADGADEYSFQIRLMSPVYEGSIAVLSGDRVIVNANDFVNGANITEKDIEGRDYNNNNLYIFPNAEGETEDSKAWSNKQIWDVTPSVDKDHYIDSAVMTAVTLDEDGKITANGVINIKGRSLSKDTNIDLPVTITDAWGYKLDVTIPVTVKVGE